jgi:hypothetical protein
MATSACHLIKFFSPALVEHSWGLIDGKYCLLSPSEDLLMGMPRNDDVRQLAWEEEGGEKSASEDFVDIFTSIGGSREHKSPDPAPKYGPYQVSITGMSLVLAGWGWLGRCYRLLTNRLS